MSRDLFAIMGFDGHLKTINPAWEATLGFDEATLLSRPFPEQVHPDDHGAVEASSNACAAVSRSPGSRTASGTPTVRGGGSLGA
jgi:hypothetical protein